MAKTRVFISYDYDNDARIKDLLVGQARNEESPFEIADWSIKQTETSWKAKARQRIKASDTVCVLCGKHTNAQESMAWTHPVNAAPTRIRSESRHIIIT